MSEHTTFKIGGPADLFVSPSSIEELRALLDLFKSGEIPVAILGGGSNLLVADRGIRGAVVCLGSLARIERVAPETATGCLPTDSQAVLPAGLPAGLPEGTVLVRAESGVPMNDLVEWCANESLASLERFSGLPGTVGGAVFMNARCYERSISDVFFSASVLRLTKNGYTIETCGFDESEWSYKRSPFQTRAGIDPLVVSPGECIVLSADFRLIPGNRDELRAEMAKYVLDREGKGHFRFPSAGSMFKNNHAFGKPSGRLIDEAGLRGFRIGDAQVAPWHGNIVINCGNARAQDVRELVTEVQRRVFAATGFQLESEVLYAGEW
jgi:UDP-N-acetylmuramate dehydrogenase